MYCIQPAKIGGESIFIDMKDVFLFMINSHPELLSTLFLKDAATVIRNDIHKTGPVFVLKDNLIEAYFSNHEYNQSTCSIKSKIAYEIIDTYIKNKKESKNYNFSSWFFKYICKQAGSAWPKFFH